MDREESLDDIEAAYQRAMMVVDATETLLPTDALTGSEASVDQDGESSAFPVAPAQVEAQAIDDAGPVLHPREILEAALFVGGQSLTTKRLSQMLGGVQATERIDADIDQLNSIYRNEARPYQIDFGEGGYRLVLLPEYEPIRNAVFGTGPNEVKLSQEALEILAFVAYRQPVSQDDLEEAGKQNPLATLRQLLRRQLVSLDRTEEGQVTYSTTPRFLELFGLRSVEDLPFPEDFELK